MLLPFLALLSLFPLYPFSFCLTVYTSFKYTHEFSSSLNTSDDDESNGSNAFKYFDEHDDFFILFNWYYKYKQIINNWYINYYH